MTSPTRIDTSRSERDRPPVDEIMSRAMESGPPSWRRRGVRRTAVLAFAALLAVHVVGLLIDSAVLFLSTVLLSLPIFALLNLGTRGIFELPAMALDERMRIERVRFHEIAYRVNYGVLLAMVVGVGLVAAADASARVAFVIVEAGVVIVAVMPRLAGAWLLPDDPDVGAEDAAGDTAPQSGRRSVWRDLWKASACSDLLRADWRSPDGRRTLWLFIACGLGGGLFGFMMSLATSR